MGATDLTTGSTVTIDYDDLEKHEYVSAIIGSASLPVLFPPREFRDQLLIDGGVSWNLNIVSAFKKCMEMVDNDPSRIILDVIVMFSNKIEDRSAHEEFNPIHNLMRIKDIKDQQALNNDIGEFMKAFPEVQYRYFIQPDKQIMGKTEALNFSQSNILKGLRSGTKAA